MNVLITGGAGFIGSHVARALAERGDTVVVLDDLNDLVYPASLKRARLNHLVPQAETVTFVQGDVTDEQTVTKLFSEHAIDGTIHLAAHANPAVSVDHAREYSRVNIDGTITILAAAAAAKVKNVVFAGSSSVYSDETVPFQENSYPLRPRSPYGASKAAAELYCQMMHDLEGLPITILRFFSVYGPWGRPDMAPWIFAERILAGDTIEVNREERQRDFTYIDDVVPAIVAALDQPRGFEIVNVGRGEPHKVTELVSAIEAAAGKQAAVTERAVPPGEMRITYADITKARQLLGYEPKVSLEEGAVQLVNWLRSPEAAEILKG